MIQEWWGLVPHIKNVCDRFAAEGFVGARARTCTTARRPASPTRPASSSWRSTSPRPRRTCAGAATLPPARTPRRPSSARWASAWGASSPSSRRTLNPAVGACVNFYGIHPNVKPDYAKLSGPGARPLRREGRLRDARRSRGRSTPHQEGGQVVEIHIYPGVDHAFFNDERADVYDKAAAEDAWRRTLAFFRQHLRVAGTPRAADPETSRGGVGAPLALQLPRSAGPSRRRRCLSRARAAAAAFRAFFASLPFGSAAFLPLPLSPSPWAPRAGRPAPGSPPGRRRRGASPVLRMRV